MWIHQADEQNGLQMFQDLPQHLRGQVVWWRIQNIMDKMHAFKVSIELILAYIMTCTASRSTCQFSISLTILSSVYLELTAQCHCHTKSCKPCNTDDVCFLTHVSASSSMAASLVNVHSKHVCIGPGHRFAVPDCCPCKAPQGGGWPPDLC